MLYINRITGGGELMREIKNVSKAYKKGIKVVNNLSLTIKDGEIFGFLGPNGAGKTTTIKMITGILEIDSGKILIDGKDLVLFQTIQICF